MRDSTVQYMVSSVSDPDSLNPDPDILLISIQAVAESGLKPRFLTTNLHKVFSSEKFLGRKRHLSS